MQIERFIDSKKLKLTVLFLTVLFLMPLTFTNAGSLVSRDDFIVFDTSLRVSLENYTWLCSSIDSSGNIYQSNAVDVDSSIYSYFYGQFNNFDSYGNQLQQVTNYLPYDKIDTNWSVQGRYFCHTNDNLLTCLIGKQKPNLDIEYSQAFVYLLDKNGNNFIEPQCLDCDLPTLAEGHYHAVPYGGMNNNNVFGAAWRLYVYPPNYYESINVRLYYPDSDSLSPIIDPKQLVQPIIGIPGYEDDDYMTYQSPDMKVADDGSFAVAWMPNHNTREKFIYYVVYNADYTQKSEVMIANCKSGIPYEPEYLHRIRMCMEADGDFYISWLAEQATPTISNRSHVWMRGFNSDGTPKYDPIRVNDCDSLWLTMFDEIQSYIVCDDSGNVVVSWADSRDFPYDEHGKPRNVYIQKINKDGDLVGLNQRINNVNGSAIGGDAANCAINNSGQVMISWRNNAEVFPRLCGQLMPFDSIGNFVSGDINYDMTAGISDITTFVDYLFLGSSISFWPRGLVDFNGDDTHGNISDLTYLISYFFQNGLSPVIPETGIRANPGKF